MKKANSLQGLAAIINPNELVSIQEMETKVINNILDTFYEDFAEVQREWDNIYWQPGRPMPESAALAREQFRRDYLENWLYDAIDKTVSQDTVIEMFGDYESLMSLLKKEAVL